MNVVDSDRVTLGIKYLRSEVYKNESFKENFTKQLQNKLNATDVNFIAEKYGGWSVEVTTDESNGIENNQYLNQAKESLFEAVSQASNVINDYSDMAYNLLNVIPTGPNSVIIKI